MRDPGVAPFRPAHRPAHHFNTSKSLCDSKGQDIFQRQLRHDRSYESKLHKDFRILSKLSFACPVIVPCVELRPYPSPRSAGLIYLLDPRYWGQVLALRMAWTAITHALLSSQIDSVIAAADLPNTA